MLFLEHLLGRRASRNKGADRRGEGYVLSMNAMEEIAHLLRRVRPYLIIKRGCGDLLLEFIEKRLASTPDDQRFKDEPSIEEILPTIVQYPQKLEDHLIEALKQRKACKCLFLKGISVQLSAVIGLRIER